MTAYKIESRVPAPLMPAGKWNDMSVRMKIGDSVMVGSNSERKGLCRALGKNGDGYVSRKTNEGYRVWRTQ